MSLLIKVMIHNEEIEKLNQLILIERQKEIKKQKKFIEGQGLDL